MNEKIALQLQTARDSLIDARVLLEGARYPKVLNCTYYAMFYAATAMLFQDGVECDSHYGVKIKFSELFVKTRRIDKRYGRILSEAFDQREDADYVLETRKLITREKAEFEIRNAAEFLAMAQEFIEGAGGERE